MNRHLSCYVASNSISCGGAVRAKLSAEIESNGEIVLLAMPDKRAASPLLVAKRALCNAVGTCSLEIAKP